MGYISPITIKRTLNKNNSNQAPFNEYQKSDTGNLIKYDRNNGKI